MAEQEKQKADAEKSAAEAKKKADAESAKGNEQRVNEKYGVYWISAPHFLQQAGEGEPRYIVASPQSPEKVVLPLKVMRKQKDGSFVEEDYPTSAHLKRDKQAAPLDVSPGLRVPKVAPAHEAIKQQVAGGKRAADQ